MAAHEKQFVDQIASELHRAYRKLGVPIDKDDIRQEVLLFWYSPDGQALIEKRMAEHPETWEKYIYTATKNAARKYCEKEKAYFSGYEYHDQQRYTPGQVRNLVPQALDPGSLVLASKTQEGPGAKGDAAEGGDVLAMLMDVKWAYDQLNTEQRHVVEAFGKGYPELFGPAGSVEFVNARQKWYAATRRMSDLLNWYRGPVQVH